MFIKYNFTYTSLAELINNLKVCVTLHIGTPTEKAEVRIDEEIVNIVKKFFQYKNNYAVNA